MAKFRFDGDPPGICKSRLRSKYPPAKPEALRLLAPQRGLTATGEKQKQPQQQQGCSTMGFGNNKSNSRRYTPGILKVLLPPRQSRGNSRDSKYPPAKPEALRLLAPQRGLTATGEKQKQPQQQQGCSTMGFGNNKSNSRRYTPGILKVLLPPRQSRGNSRDIRLPTAYPRGRFHYE
jgi:hypothetical protein